MTKARIALEALLEKSGDRGFLRELPSLMLERLMHCEVEGRRGAERYERGAQRLMQRNSYRERDFETRLGTVELKIPKLRQGSDRAAFPEPRRVASISAGCGGAEGV